MPNVQSQLAYNSSGVCNAISLLSSPLLQTEGVKDELVTACPKASRVSRSCLQFLLKVPSFACCSASHPSVPSYLCGASGAALLQQPRPHLPWRPQQQPMTLAASQREGSPPSSRQPNTSRVPRLHAQTR